MIEDEKRNSVHALFAEMGFDSLTVIQKRHRPKYYKSTTAL